MLGTTPVNYQTSSQAQSELIPEKGRYDNRLTDEQKQKLRRSQFTLGTSKNDFSTDYNLEYYDKSSLNNLSNGNELKAIREKLRGSNYDMGNDINMLMTIQKIVNPIELSKWIISTSLMS